MSVKTRQDKTTSLQERGDLSDLFASALVHIRGDKRSSTQRTNLRTALQLFNENRLGAVIPGMTDSLPANLLELLSMPPGKILPASIARYIEVRYFGELFLPASHWSSGKTSRALADFVANLGIPYNLNLDVAGWVPPYASDAEVLSVWNKPLHEIKRSPVCGSAAPDPLLKDREPKACISVGQYLRNCANRHSERGHRDPRVAQYLASQSMLLPMFVPKIWSPPTPDLEVCKHFGYEDWDGIQVLSWKKRKIQERGFPTIESLTAETVVTLGEKLENLTNYATQLVEQKGLMLRAWKLDDSGSNENLGRRIDSLEFSIRTSSCLQLEGIEFVHQLVAKTEGELLRVPNFGRKSLNEVKAVLVELGLALK